MLWTGYLDSSGADYSAGGFIDATQVASRRVTLDQGFAYLVTATVDVYWAHGGGAVTAGIAVPGSGLLVRGAAVVVEAKGATSGFLAHIRVGGADGTIFLQKRPIR